MLLPIFLAFVVCHQFNEVDDLPFEADKPNIKEEEQLNEEIDEEIEEAPQPTPGPPPKVIVPLKDLVTYRELIVAAGLVIFGLFYFVGRISISKQKNSLCKKLFPLLREHFAIVPNDMAKLYLHRFSTYITGRSGYQGLVVSVIYPAQCDIFGKIMSILRGTKTKIVFEFIPEPPKKVPAFLRVTNTKPHFFEEMKLKSVNVSDKLNCYTDFGEKRSEFLPIINSFIEEYPSCLSLVELSDSNIYETQQESQYVARFEFDIGANVESFISEEVIKFMITIADMYVLLKLPKEDAEKNLSIRNKMLSENKKKEPEEKPLTPEEKEKLQKKLEKREAKRLVPKVKYSK